MVQCFPTSKRRIDADPERFLHAFLADVLTQLLGSQSSFKTLFFFKYMSGQNAVFHLNSVFMK